MVIITKFAKVTVKIEIFTTNGLFPSIFQEKNSTISLYGHIGKNSNCGCYLALNKPGLTKTGSLEENSQGQPSKIKLSKQIRFHHHFFGQKQQNFLI